MYRWRQQSLIPMSGGVGALNFKNLAIVYSEAMKKAGVDCVSVFAADDETTVVPKVVYNQQNDSLLGSCGPNKTDHQCENKVVVKVEDGEEGYAKIKESFSNMRIGNYA